MLKRASAALLLLSLIACGGNSSPGPSPTPTPTTFTLTGQVTDSATGAGIGGATVAVIDGPNASKSATTDGSGIYTLSGLQQGGFTARARAQYYNEFSKGVTLTSNQAVNFSLSLIPIFSIAGTGDTVFDVPTRVSRVRIKGAYGGRCQNFVVWIGSDLLVNVILGTCSIASGTTFDGTYLTTGGVGRTELSTGVSWSITEIR